MLASEKTALIFSNLHDGSICTWTGNRDLLTLTIECPYLAEQIDSSYELFYVELKQIDQIALIPWANLPIVKTELAEVFANELEILSADIQNNVVVVSCKLYDANVDYTGANLLIHAGDIQVLDQGKQEWSTEQFKALSKKYWQ